jgi:hypothetical protein
MMWRALAVMVAVTTVAPSVSHADTYALIVTNNRSLELGRPDLQYADDDGAKYYELFAMVADEGNLALLTELDADTRKLFPDADGVARKPTKANVTSAAADLAKKTRAAIDAGREVDFYFVFAGHGDVDNGRGFLELADGPFDSDDLASGILETVPYTRAHVILDSCNSFFVINPRKAGGKRFATPSDAAADKAKLLPNVGVFLSTSAEAEVFEWSALQSGIFSHAVRSGLSGAADADGDGTITYLELEAFASVASAEVRNPLYRPKVFARGPNDARDTALLSLRGATASTIEIGGDEAMRLTVRDADELRWIDTYKEAGASVTLRVPDRVAAKLSIDELEIRDDITVTVKRHTGSVPANEPVTIAMLDPAELGTAARGADDLFRMLFTRPFGPSAVAQYERTRVDSPEPIFGIAQEDVSRMEHLLMHTSEIDRQTKYAKFAPFAGVGLALVVGGAWLTQEPETSPLLESQQTRNRAGLVLMGAGAVGVLYGGIMMLRKSHGERIYDKFLSDMANTDDAVSVVASTELLLDEIRNRERTWRKRVEVLGWMLAGGSALALAGNELFGPDEYKTEARLVLSGGVLVGAIGALVIRSNITPVERMVEIWQGDPSLSRLPRLSITPTNGGAIAGLGGTF